MTLFLSLIFVITIPQLNMRFCCQKLDLRFAKKEILNLIYDSISQSTVSIPTMSRYREKQGVPQGLSISNILANIYLKSLDKKYLANSEIRYFRFVDDILIFCNNKDIGKIGRAVKNDCRKLGLKLHGEDENTGKTIGGVLTKGFTYLGYKFVNNSISVRNKSIERIRERIIKHLTKYRYIKDIKIKSLEWKINLIITGCIFDDRKYGWLFYFSQIDDQRILHSLDHFVNVQLKRFDLIKSNIRIKKFVRAYFEIKKNLFQTSYIPKFNDYSVNQKRQVLTNIYGFDKDAITDENVEYYFRKKIFSAVRELEKDLAKLS